MLRFTEQGNIIAFDLNIGPKAKLSEWDGQVQVWIRLDN